MFAQREYVAEVNRSYNDNIRIAARRLRNRGLDVDLLPHKTTMLVVRPSGMSWEIFTTKLLSALDPRRGSMLLFSKATGNVFICSNAGNQPGEFLKH
jgi:hypothetical protein